MLSFHSYRAQRSHNNLGNIFVISQRQQKKTSKQTKRKLPKEAEKSIVLHLTAL